MRVLFLTLYPESAASPRYRVAQFLPYLRAHGIECNVAATLPEAAWRRLAGPGRTARPFWYHAQETPRRIAQILGAGRYEVVFLQKAILSAYVRGMAGLLRACARRLVYDIDDAVQLSSPHPLRAPWSLLEDRPQIEKVIRAARVVLAGNRWLANMVECSGGRAAYFPTVVDTDRFTPGPPPNVYRIGWIGSPGTTGTLEVVAPVLRELCDAEVLLVGADASALRWDGPVQAWSYETEVAAVQQFAVGLLPQHKDTWTLGKCALKALLYMACGIPCVATPYGAVLDIIRHGENGLFADSREQWREALERLRDPELRQRLGEAGRAMVERQFSLRVAAPRMLELLREAA